MRYIHEILCVQEPNTYAVTYTCIHPCTHEIIDAAIKPTISQPCVRSNDDPRWHTGAPPRLRFCSLRAAAARRSASARYCWRQSVCVRITPSFSQAASPHLSSRDYATDCGCAEGDKNAEDMVLREKINPVVENSSQHRHIHIDITYICIFIFILLIYSFVYLFLFIYLHMYEYTHTFKPVYLHM